MQTLLSERRDNRGLLTGGAGVMFRNFRYIIWFFVLNLILGWFGIMAFAGQAHGTLDQSLYADRLVHGFDLAVLFELLAKPEVVGAGSWSKTFLANAVICDEGTMPSA